MSVTSYADRQEFLYSSPEAVDHGGDRTRSCKQQTVGKSKPSHTSFRSVKRVPLMVNCIGS